MDKQLAKSDAKSKAGRPNGRKNTFDLRKLENNLGLQTIPPSLEQYLKPAQAFAYIECTRFARQIGPISPSCSAIIQSAALQLAASRSAFASGELMLGSKLAEAAAKSLQIAHNLAREDAGLSLNGGGKRPDWIDASRKFFETSSTSQGSSDLGNSMALEAQLNIASISQSSGRLADSSTTQPTDLTDQSELNTGLIVDPGFATDQLTPTDHSELYARTRDTESPDEIEYHSDEEPDTGSIVDRPGFATVGSSASFAGKEEH